MRSLFLSRRLCGLCASLLALQLAGCGLTLAPPGFVRESRHGVSRGWFDFNSYRRHSFTLESYDHLPPESSRVKLFRWLHHGSVEKLRIVRYDEAAILSQGFPVEVPEIVSPALPPAIEDSPKEPSETPPPVDAPPPAPPSDSSFGKEIEATGYQEPVAIELSLDTAVEESPKRVISPAKCHVPESPSAH